MSLKLVWEKTLGTLQICVVGIAGVASLMEVGSGTGRPSHVNIRTFAILKPSN